MTHEKRVVSGLCETVAIMWGRYTRLAPPLSFIFIACLLIFTTLLPSLNCTARAPFTHTPINPIRTISTSSCSTYAWLCGLPTLCPSCSCTPPLSIYWKLPPSTNLNCICGKQALFESPGIPKPWDNTCGVLLIRCGWAMI